MKRSIFFPASLVVINLFLFAMCASDATQGISPKLNWFLVAVNMGLAMINFNTIRVIRNTNQLIEENDSLNSWSDK